MLLSLQFAGARAKQRVAISHYCWKCGSSCDYRSTGGCDPDSGVCDYKKIQGESQCSIYKVKNIIIVTFFKHFNSRCVDVSSATPMDMSNLNEPSVMRSNDAYDTAVDEEAVADEHGYETVH